MFDLDTIYTDASGRPIPRPQRADYATDIEYLRALNAYSDAIRGLATQAFSTTFTRAIRSKP